MTESITCDGIGEGLGEGEREDGDDEAMESCLVREALNAFSSSIVP